MLGRYQSGSTQGISSSRTRDAIEQIKRVGGEVKEIYAMLGDQDICFIAELPGIEQAMAASVNIGRVAGLSFTTHPAVRADIFDDLTGGS